MASKLGEAFVEVFGDADPFADDLANAMGEAGVAAEAQLTDAFDGITDGIVDDFTETGAAAGEGLADAIQDAADDVSIEVDVDVDADIDIDIDESVFDGLTDAANEASEGIVDAFDGVGAEIAGQLDEASGAFDGVAGSLGSLTGALGTAAGGAGMEAFARAQLPLTEQSRRLAESLDVTEDEIRNLALASSDVTRPLEQVLETMEIGRQQGLKNTDQLMDFVSAWDLVGDASGENADELAKLSPALAAVGVEAHETEKAHQAFGYMLENTTMDVGEFMAIINRMGPDLREMNLDVDDTAAVLGAMQGELGLTGRVARTEFSRAVNAADGDMKVMLETLGLTEEEFAAYRAEVDQSGHILERNAAIHADSYTLMQRGQHVLQDLMFRFGGVADAASLVAAPLGAIGPMMFGMNQASQLMAGGLGTKLVGGLKAAATGFRTLSVAILTNPLFLIAAVIVGIIAVVWIFRDEIMAALGQAWDWIKEVFGNLVEWFSGVWSGVTEGASGAFSAVLDWFSELPGRIVDALAGLATTLLTFLIEWHPLAIMYRLISENWDQIVAWFSGLAETVTGWFSNMADAVVAVVTGWIGTLLGWFSDLRDSAVEAVAQLWDAAVSIFNTAVDTVVGLVTRFVQNLVAGVTWLWNQWVSIVHTIRDAVIGAISGLVSSVVSMVSSWVRRIVGFVRDLWQRIRRFFDGGIEGLKADIRRGFNNVIDFFRNLPRRIIEAIGNVKKLLFDIGKDLLKGLADGIKNAAMAPVRAVTDVGRNIVGGAKRLFGMTSPSKLMADEIGGPIMEGVAVGMRDHMAAAIDELERFANEAASTRVSPLNIETNRSDQGTIRPGDIPPPGAGSGADAMAGFTLLLEQNIYTLDPIKAGRASIRELRDVAYLAAPFEEPRRGVPDSREVDRVR